MHTAVFACVVIAGLLIAGAIVWSAPRYALAASEGEPALRLDLRTGEIAVCVLGNVAPQGERFRLGIACDGRMPTRQPVDSLPDA